MFLIGLKKLGMHNIIKGQLTIIGAGPGDPELITLKGIKAIKQAEVILFDALVNRDLLKYNSTGEHYFVGKRKGAHSFKQDEINSMLVDFVQAGKKVVRLKGGDVSVFARAAEEIAYAQKFGISPKLIPGISSYTGIAAAHRIPLTRRCQYESIWVSTGFTCDGKPSSDIVYAAQSSSTVIILMGITHLEEIVTLFRQYKPKNYPIAIVQNGTLSNEKWVKGTLDDIIFCVKENQISSPASIFIGPAVEDPTGTWIEENQFQYA